MDRVLARGLLVAAAALGGCGAGTPSGNQPATVRIGYFANVTHAPAIVAIAEGYFDEALGPGAVKPHVYNAGPEAVEALFSNALDIAYVGPNPAITAFTKSEGAAIRIIAGATSGGAALVVHPSITAAAQLKGTKLATPQLGNTQDVALRSWLKEQGLATSFEGGGDVSIVLQQNAQTLETFRSDVIQGAWVPEPWATRLVLEGGGTVLVDERSLWPGGRFVTTHVIVRTAFLEEHPETVAAFLRAHVRAIDLLNAEPEKARAIVNEAIGGVVGKQLPAEVIERAWTSLTFTVDPIASSLYESAKDARGVGLLDEASLDGIYDLRRLNAILAAAGKPPVSD